MAFKRTKIVCTIGPASSSPDVLERMVRAGMNVARLNFSHGTHEEHAELIRTIRSAAHAVGEPVAILQDLQGPKIRAGVLPKEGVELKAGARVTFTTGESAVDAMRLPVTYEFLHKDVKVGERILLDDGLLSAKVVEVQGRDVVCEVIDGGTLTSHKGVNFPDSKLSISPITEKDKADVVFGVAQGVDFVALSFVRSAREIEELRGIIAHAEKISQHPQRSAIRIIAKVEKREAVEAMDEIIEASDVIMVARGDLGIEMAPERVPIVQKQLVAKCRAAAKPVIVATQMLDSMIRNPRPTRAEVSDVANAVIDHADAVMLSGETAGGAHPLEAVEMMAKIVRETEDSTFDDIDVEHRRGDARSVDEAVSEIANVLVRDVDVRLVAVASPQGDLGRIVSRFRPEMPILVVTDDERIQRQLNVSWGVLPVCMERSKDAEAFFKAVTEVVKSRGLADSGEKMVVIGGDPIGALSDRVEIRELP
ncbi:MAG: pyruvate kinase [Patescibacteria group bacterium]|nr:MAG: pyruvate kinase [Patescibacteria group bacterium]